MLAHCIQATNSWAWPFGVDRTKDELGWSDAVGRVKYVHCRTAKPGQGNGKEARSLEDWSVPVMWWVA